MEKLKKIIIVFIAIICIVPIQIKAEEMNETDPASENIVDSTKEGNVETETFPDNEESTEKEEQEVLDNNSNSNNIGTVEEPKVSNTIPNNAIDTTKNGFIDENGNRYYYEHGIMYQGGIRTIDGKDYLFDDSGKMQKGFQVVGNHLYYFGRGSFTQQKGRFLDEDGYRYYFGVDGEVYRGGIRTIDGKDYLFDDSGKMQKGFQVVGNHLYYFGRGSFTQQKGRFLDEDGYRYYFGVDGEVYRGGIRTIDGKDYLFDDSGKMQKGFQVVGNHLYYFGRGSFTQQKGRFLDEDGYRYYFAPDGEVYRNGIKMIDGKEYGFDQDGRMLKGFNEVGGYLYYFGKGSFTLQKNKFFDEDGYRYYFAPDGKVYKDGIKTIDGKEYLFDSEGRMLKGFQKVGNHLYYFGRGSFTQQKGRFLDEDGYRYYFAPDGEVYRDGIKTIDGKEYAFDKDGRMLKGHHWINGNLYYFGFTNGDMQKDHWYIENGKNKYYFGSNGMAYRSGLTNINGNEYYFENNGTIVTGPKVINGNINCFGVVTGIKQYNKWYHFDANTIYYVDANGNAYTNKDSFIDGNWYKFGADGKLQTGWQEINGHKYYLYANGTRATCIAKIAGVRYEFSTTGELQHSNIKIIADISQYQGVIDWNALWASGEIDGVILRIGVTGRLDSLFEYNLKEVKRLNIPYSVYHFSLAENADEALFEANNFINWYRKYDLHPSMEVFYDLESWKNSEDGHTSDGITTALYDQIISMYITKLGQAGITSRIYTGKNYALDRFTEAARNWVTWIAQYATDCTYPYSYRGWQYTSKAVLPGITANTVDLSIFYY